MLPLLPFGDEVVLAQKAAGFSGKAREEEVFVEALVANSLWRGEAVTILDPALRREVLQIDPAGGAGLARHQLYEEVGQLAGKGLDYHLAWGHVGRKGLMPVLDIDAIDPLAILRRVEPRTDAGETCQIVHPEPHLNLIAMCRNIPLPF